MAKREDDFLKNFTLDTCGEPNEDAPQHNHPHVLTTRLLVLLKEIVGLEFGSSVAISAQTKELVKGERSDGRQLFSHTDEAPLECLAEVGIDCGTPPSLSALNLESLPSPGELVALLREKKFSLLYLVTLLASFVEHGVHEVSFTTASGESISLSLTDVALVFVVMVPMGQPSVSMLFASEIFTKFMNVALEVLIRSEIPFVPMATDKPLAPTYMLVGMLHGGDVWKLLATTEVTPGAVMARDTVRNSIAQAVEFAMPLTPQLAVECGLALLDVDYANGPLHKVMLHSVGEANLFVNERRYGFVDRLAAALCFEAFDFQQQQKTSKQSEDSSELASFEADPVIPFLQYDRPFAAASDPFVPLACLVCASAFALLPYVRRVWFP